MTTLRRRRKDGLDPAEVVARRAWKMNVVVGGCAMCRDDPPSRDLKRTRALDLLTIDAHHLVPKRTLRNTGHADKLWDERNGIPLCRYHHLNHEAWATRLPRRLVPLGAFEFALEIGLDYVLDSEYPPERAAA